MEQNKTVRRHKDKRNRNALRLSLSKEQFAVTKLKNLLILAVALSVAVVAALPAAAQNEGEVAITLERGVCMGTCPAYTLTIYTDGRVVFNGEHNTTVEGEQEIQIEPETVEQLVAGFEAAGFFEWEDEYTEMTVSDLPYVTTSVTRDGETKTVRRYTGDSNAPLALPYLELWIDLATYSSQWTNATNSFSSVMTMNTPVMTLERQACFGTCPVYMVAVFADGSVVYLGLNHVDEVGIRTANVSPDDVEFLAMETELFGYFGWNDEYLDMKITDQAYVTSSLNYNDQWKEIRRYDGDFNAPIGLVRFEDRIDTLVNIDQWIGNGGR